MKPLTFPAASRSTARGSFRAGVLALATAVAACGGSEPDRTPSAPVIESPQDGAVFQTGEPVLFLGAVDDPEDGPLSGASLVWTSSLDGAVGTGGAFTRTDLSEGHHSITLTGTDSEGNASVGVTRITVADEDPETPVIDSPVDGDEYGPTGSILFQGSAFDPEDGPLTGASLVWRSTLDGELGTGTSFVLAGLTEGQHGISLTATDSNGQSAQVAVPITVANQAPVVSIVAPEDGSIFSTGTLVELHGTAEDPEDGPLGGEALTWRSSLDGDLGQGSPLATDALSDGLHGVTLEAVDSRGLTATATVEIGVGPVFILTSELAPGRAGMAYEATLDAFGGTPPFQWGVAAGSLPAGLGLDTQTGVVSGAPQAVGSSAFTVQVTDAEGGTATADLELPVCGPVLDLAVGEAVVTDWPFGCGQVLARAAAQYRVALMARSVGEGDGRVPGGFLLRAVAGTPGEAFPSPPARARWEPRPPSADDALGPETRALARATERLHMRLREEERALVPNAPGGGPSVLGPPLEAAGLAAPEKAAVQDRTFFVNDPQARQRIQIDATLRGQSASLLYYEDVGVVLEGTQATDEEVQKILDYYEAYGRPLIDEVFGGLGPEGTTRNFSDGGGPALTLPADDIDQNGGRLIVLQIRPSLMPGGAAAYVSSCDRRPRQANYAAGGFYCTRSNQAEITYISRPASNFYLGSVVHEAKHVSSHGYAIFADRGFNPSWIEEGTAEIAKEKSSRDASGLPDGMEAGRGDVYPIGQLTAETYGMGVVHSRARSYLRAAPISALVGNPDPNPQGSTYYGASWLFHRFLADAYGGGDEDAFFRALNTGGAGPGHIEQVTGRGLAEILGEFVVAVAVEGEPEARAALPTGFRSYDFADVASGFQGAWPYVVGSGGDAFATGDLELPAVHYTAATFFDLSGAGATWLRLDLLRGDGQEHHPADAVALAVVRIR